MIVNYESPQPVTRDDFAGSDQDVRAASQLYEGQDATKIIKMYLEENLPDELREDKFLLSFWAIMGKKLQLTFLEKEDLPEFYAVFEQAKLAYFMSIPAEKFDYDALMRITQIEIYFVAALKSAVGSQSGKINERTMLNTAIQQNVVSRTERIGSTESGGMLSKLARKMGM